MECELDAHEHRIARDILGLAESKYQAEWEVNPLTSFNLLKLLSAYNDILPRYGLSSVTENRIYSYLLNIAKRFNPLSREQWNAALSHPTTASPFRSLQRKRTCNTPVSEFINESTDDHSKISLKSFKSRPKSLSRREFLLHQDDSQNDIRQVEELNFHRKDYSKYENTTLAMTLSRDNMKNLLNLPTCDTHQDEEDPMQTRAELFARINTFSKVFLVFKASLLVRQEIYTKTIKMLNKLERFRTATQFRQFVSVVHSLRGRRAETRKAEQFHQQKLKSVSFSCLSMLKQISTKPKPASCPTYVGNNYSLQFLLSLLGTGLDSEVSSKFQVLWRRGDFKDAAGILRMFGGCPGVSEQTLATISFKMHSNSKRSIFSILKSNTSKHKNEYKSILTLQKVEVIQKLRDNSTNSKDVETKFKACLRLFRHNTLSGSLWFLKRWRLEREKRQLAYESIKLSEEQRLKECLLGAMKEGFGVRLEQKKQKREHQRGVQQHQERQTLRRVLEGLKRRVQDKKLQEQSLQKADKFRDRGLMCAALEGLIKNTLLLKKERLAKMKEQHTQHQLVLRMFQQWRRNTSVQLIGKAFDRLSLQASFCLLRDRVNERQAEIYGNVRIQRLYQRNLFDRFARGVSRERKMLSLKAEALEESVKRMRLVECYFGIRDWYVRAQVRRIREEQHQSDTFKIQKRRRLLTLRHIWETWQLLLLASKNIKDKQMGVGNLQKRGVFRVFRKLLEQVTESKERKEEVFSLVRLRVLRRLKNNLDRKSDQNQMNNKAISCKESLSLSRKCRTLCNLGNYSKLTKIIESKAKKHKEFRLLESVFLGLKANTLEGKGVEEINARRLKKLQLTLRTSHFRSLRCGINQCRQFKESRGELSTVMPLLQKRLLFISLRNTQLERHLNNEISERMVLATKLIYLRRLRKGRIHMLPDHRLTIHRVWFNRFSQRVNQELMQRKTSEMALLHYSQTILKKSVRGFKLPSSDLGPQF